MFIKAVIGIVAAGALAAPAYAQSFVGEWTATAESPAGEQSEALVVTETADGYAITATLINPPPGTPEAGPGHDIVLDGDIFSYKRTVDLGGTSIAIAYSGTVEGDTFTGTVDLGFGQIPYRGVRN
jgi:hypothetical protein